MTFMNFCFYFSLKVSGTKYKWENFLSLALTLSHLLYIVWEIKCCNLLQHSIRDHRMDVVHIQGNTNFLLLFRFFVFSFFLSSLYFLSSFSFFQLCSFLFFFSVYFYIFYFFIFLGYFLSSFFVYYLYILRRIFLILYFLFVTFFCYSLIFSILFNFFLFYIPLKTVKKLLEIINLKF